MGNEAIICDGDPRMRGKASRNIRGVGWGDRSPPLTPRDQICHKAARTGVGVGFGEGKKVCLCILSGEQREAYPQVKGKRGVGSSQEKG